MPERPKGIKSRSALRWRGLNVQLFALVVVPLVALLLSISFGSVLLHQSAMRKLVVGRNQRAAQTAGRALSEQLNHRAAAVRGLALRASDGTNVEEILSSSAFLLTDFDAGLAFVDETGSLLAASGDLEFWNNLPSTGRVVLREAMGRAQSLAQFSLPFVHPDSETVEVFVVAKSGIDSRYAVGMFSPQELVKSSLSEAFPAGEMTTTILLGPDSQILYQQGNLTSANVASFPEILKGETGATYYQDNDDELVVAYNTISPTNWVLVIEESWETLASPILRTTEVAPLVLVPVVILALVALWFGARQIIQPLQALEAKSAALAWGDYQAVEEEVGGIAEIARLQRSLIHMAHKVRSSQQSLRGYIGAITEGQEEERRRLARELHDETIQSLIALNQKVQLAQMGSSRDSTEAALDEIKEMIEQSIKDLRRLTRDLRPIYLEDLGLAAALDILAQEISHAAGIAIRFTREGREQRLQPEIELALYRIAQEGINNVVRHAQASEASIQLSYSGKTITMTISDNGRGFEIPESPAEFASAGHYGLLGISERIELMKARLSIQSTLGEGTRIVVSVQSRGLRDNESVSR